MNYIDRGLVKSQAKEIIKGKVFLIFIVCAVALILSGSWLTTSVNLSREYYELFNDDGGASDFDYYEDFDFENPIESFEFQNGKKSNQNDIVPENMSLDAGNMIMAASGWRGLIGIVFSPLLITLSGIFLALVRRDKNQEFKTGYELKGLFLNTFDSTYFKKLGLALLQNIIILALSLLFIVPGIVFSFSSYFCYEIISDNPDMNIWDAIKTSKKIVKGNRTELFILELSFLGWYLLTGVTLGIAAIYVLPYTKTVRALYYENFRMRAMQEGRISPDDFMSVAEKAAYYSQNKTGNAQKESGAYYYTNANTASSNAQDVKNELFAEDKSAQQDADKEAFKNTADEESKNDNIG